MKRAVNAIVITLLLASLTSLTLATNIATACPSVTLQEMDLNGDGVIGMEDVLIAVQAFASYPGHPRWMPEADIVQDGVVDMLDIATIARNFGKKVPTKISAEVDIFPNVLALKSCGRWVTCRIALPKGYCADNINVSTIRINETIPVDTTGPVQLVDCDRDGISELMVKFSRKAVTSFIRDNINDCQCVKNHCVSMRCIVLTVTGRLFDGTLFEGNVRLLIIYKT